MPVTYTASQILDRALAYHEAGHQVIAHALGVAASGIELHSTGGHAHDGLPAGTYTAEIMTAADRTHCRRKILILVAGEVAERLLYEEEGWTADQFWSVADHQMVRDHLHAVFGHEDPPTELHPLTLIPLAEQILLREWKKVGCIARALLLSQSLTADEVRYLLGPRGILFDTDLIM